MNQIEKEAMESLAYLQDTMVSPRSKGLLAFAVQERNLNKKGLRFPDGEMHSAALFLMHLYCIADEMLTGLLAGQQSQEGADPMDAARETVQVVSMLYVMERIKEDSWSYGAKLDFDLARIGFRISKQEAKAFLALKGDFKSNQDKGNLLRGDPIACTLYSAALAAFNHSVTGVTSMTYRGIQNAAIAEKVVQSFAKPTQEEAIEKLCLHFLPALEGDPNVLNQDIGLFLKYLRESGFYYFPASGKYHSNMVKGLSIHTTMMFRRLMEIESPNTEREAARLLLAAIHHDFCKLGCYKQDWKNQKVYCENGDKSEADGRRFRWESVPIWTYSDPMPFGHGNKSLWMALRLPMGKYLDEEICAAIDGHMMSVYDNPAIEQQIRQYPLTLYLHIADNLATCLDEEIQ